MKMPNFVEIKNAPGKGRGGFALNDFAKGEVIEEAPVVPLTEKESLLLEKTIMRHYTFCWKTDEDAAVVLGWGAIYNYSFEANAFYKADIKKKVMVFRALKPIKKGEEILVNYNGNPDDKSPINWLRKPAK